MRNPAFLLLLARAFLAADPNVNSIVSRCNPPTGEHWRWLKPTAKKYVSKFVGKTRPREQEVIEFLKRQPGVQHAARKYGKRLPLTSWLEQEQQMQPAAAARGWDIPALTSIAALQNWLGISFEELEWFADLKGLASISSSPQLNHYSYRVLTKDTSSIRLIESPKSRLKRLQQQIYSEILSKVPPHPAVHGFVKGRSIRTCTNIHAGRRVVLRMDLKDFFPTFSARRIQAMFRAFGYPQTVADLLGGLCTNFTPRPLWKHGSQASLPLGVRQSARDLYCRPHLPQGAPTSPALANICSYRLDCRLAGLASSVGAVYTRYADDLAFSGSEEFERSIERFSIHVAAIAMEEGFHVNHRKTRIMRQGVRQHLLGLVTNRHPNIIRKDFDRLKATLTNCIRFGTESQNREQHPKFQLHLEGKVNFVESVNAAKGKRLRGLLEQIQW